MSSKKTKILTIALMLVLFAVFGVIYYFFLGCPVYRFTHFPCPGCGMTRAWLAALKFDFVLAFKSHPLWILCPFAAVGMAVTWFLKKRKIFDAIILSFAILMIITYIIRWVSGQIYFII